MFYVLSSLVKFSSPNLFNCLTQGAQLCNTAGPNAHNRIAAQATAACVKLCGLIDHSLANRGKLAIPYFKIWTFPQVTKLQLAGHGLRTPGLTHWCFSYVWLEYFAKVATTV